MEKSLLTLEELIEKVDQMKKEDKMDLSSDPSCSTPFQIGMNFKWLTDSFGERSCCRKMN